MLEQPYLIIAALAILSMPVCVLILMLVTRSIIKAVLLHLENTQVVGSINSVGVVKAQQQMNMEIHKDRLQDAREQREALLNMNGQSEIEQALE